MRVTVGFKVLVNLDSVEFINDEIYFSFYFFSTKHKYHIFVIGNYIFIIIFKKLFLTLTYQNDPKT